MDAYLKQKCQRLLDGEALIFTDAELDEIIPYNIGIYVASKPNPSQVGTKDRWIAFIKVGSIERAKNSDPFALA